MRIKAREEFYLPEDDSLPDYEKAVLAVAQRRVIKVLFRQTEVVAISRLIELTDISLNSLVATYLELKKNGYIDMVDHSLFLTASGRRWAIKNRKNIFMYRSRVKFTQPFEVTSHVAKRRNEQKSLPSSYFLR